MPKGTFSIGAKGLRKHQYLMLVVWDENVLDISKWRLFFVAKSFICVLL